MPISSNYTSISSAPVEVREVVRPTTKRRRGRTLSTFCLSYLTTPKKPQQTKMVTDVVHAKGGCIILLDVPPSSTITLDGVTRVTPSLSASTAAVSSQQQLASPFHRGLWIINNISSVDNDFHLLVVRSGNRKEATTTNSGDCRTLPVGFIISNDNTKSIYVFDISK